MPGRHVGVDIEPLDDDDPLALLAERILSDDERMADNASEAIPVAWRLSLKEAAYKALYPRAGPVPLRSITVLRRPGDPRSFTISTAAGLEIEALAQAIDGHVLSLAAVT